MSDKISYEEPSQRRTFRVTAPMEIGIDGEFYPAINWSTLDFRIENYSGKAKVNDKITVRITIPYQGFDITFKSLVKILAIEPDNNNALAGEFLSLNDREKEILSTFISGLIRGEMQSVNGVIRRMDMPVTPASLHPDTPLTAEDIAVQDRKRKVGGILYGIVGLIFTILLAVVIYTNFFQIKIETATMSAPTDIIISPATGVLARQSVDLRDTVAVSETLMQFVDPELEQKIDRAALRLEEAIIGNNGQSGEVQSNINNAAISSARAAVQAQQNNLNLQTRQVARLREMIKKGLARKIELEKAQAAYYRAQAALNNAMQNLSKVTQSGGNSQTTLLSLAEGEYKLLKDQRHNLDVVAPANGKIINYLVREGGSVRYGDPVAIFQHSNPKYVEAYLTREEALSIAIGDAAKVYFPSHDHKTAYVIKDIDYASLLISKREGRYAMEQAGRSRDVLVRLDLVDESSKDIADSITPGSSVVVIFNKPMFR